MFQMFIWKFTVHATAQESAAERTYPTPEARGSGQEELPHILGQRQKLCFPGAAVKRYPTSRETQVRW